MNKVFQLLLRDANFLTKNIFLQHKIEYMILHKVIEH